MEERHLPDDVILRALEAARTRAASAEKQRSDLDREIAAAREEQRLLEDLLALRQNGSRPGAVPDAADSDRVMAPSRSAGESLLQAVVHELQAAGRPVHISELMRLLKARNAYIPGSGAQANLITYLRRDDRVVRPSRGMYALAASGLKNMDVPRRKHRRRTHFVSRENGGRSKS